LIKIFVLALAVFAGLLLVTRFWPVVTSDWPGAPMATGQTEQTHLSGFYIRRDDLSFTQIQNRILATSRHAVLMHQPRLKVVLRSRVWGFKDIVELWRDESGTHLRGYSTIGGSDWGSNKKRIKAWIAD
jgi:uncharacterized protein (DUF1499 family)